MENKNTNTYQATITESSRDFTAREKLKYTDTAGMIKLADSLKEHDELVLQIVDYAVVEVENAKAKEDNEYRQYVLIANDDKVYYTGSESFWNSYKQIFDVMKEEDEEYEIKIYRVASKNRQGQSFITCSII